MFPSEIHQHISQLR